MCTAPQRISLPESINLDNIKKIHGGGGHVMILDQNGRLYGCGWNAKGQLGLCNTNDSNIIKPLLKTDSQIVDIFCGWDSTAAIDENGQLYVWGSNAFDQLGFSANFIDNMFTFPMLLNLPMNEKAKKVCFGLRYMCILCESQNIYIVGRWRFLENCKTIVHNDTNFHQIVIPTNLNCKDIASGSNHIVCLCVDKCTASERIIGFGDNKFLQCSAQHLNEINVKTLCSGWFHNGILTDNGSVLLWGRNTYGQLGKAEDDQSDRMVNLHGITEKVEQLNLGAQHGLIVSKEKDIFTWGWNEHGNCGNGNETNL